MGNEWLLAGAAWAGKFHPLAVHLPIGILLLGALFLTFGFAPGLRGHTRVAPLIFFCGAIGALASSVTGWLLAATGTYEAAAVDPHRWAGVALTIWAFASWRLLVWGEKHPKAQRIRTGVALLTTAGVTVAGHLGGSLTHGEDFLSWPSSEAASSPKIKSIAAVDSAFAYADLIKPLLEQKCTACHNASKQRGRLRLDAPEFILRGGKSGKPLLGSAAGSELLRRIDLPLSDEYHMPPRERAQLTQAEAALLHWWVGAGANFEKKVAELPRSPEEDTLLQGLADKSGDAADEEWPSVSAPFAPAPAVDALRQAGVLVLPLAPGSSYLQASFIAVPHAGDSLAALLEPLAAQLVSLKLTDTQITDAAMASVGRLTALRRLYLDGCLLTDAGLKGLAGLTELRLLSLTRTEVTNEGLLALSALPKLEVVYLYQTSIDLRKWSDLALAFPRTRLDSGGYRLQNLVSDTTVFRLKR